MYKILIVDDESIIVESCKLIIEKEMGERFTVYKAFSGEEALKQIMQENISIVLTDILMPGMNGLELIRRSHEAGRYPSFILITAYDDFDYAKKAISLGATDYILKPINKAIVIECLKRAADMLDKEQADRNRISRYEEEHNRLVPFIEKRLVEMALYSTGRKNEITYYASMLDMDFSSGIAACIHCSDGSGMSKVIAYIRDKKKCAADILASDHFVLLFPGERTVPDQETKEQLESILSRTVDSFSRQGIEISYGIGDRWTDADGIRLSYQQARDRLRLAGSTPFSHTVENEFAGLLAQGDVRCKDRFGELYERYYRKYDSDTAALKKALSPLIKIVLESFSEHYDSDYIKDQETHLKEIPSADLLREYLVSMIDTACRDNRSVYMKNSDQIVEKVAKYVREHYADSLMLEDLTQRFNYSMAYLSHIFHKKRGKTLSEYITEVRMEKANELLVDTSLSIQEIGERVGYRNSNYFSRKYKKRFGMTPTEYAQEKRKEREDQQNG